MNRLLTFAGGQPFTTGDLDFIQECYANTLQALARGLTGGRPCVLWGIGVGGTFSTGTVRPGAVAIGGEVFIVAEELQGNDSTRYLCFKRTEQEERTFNDSQAHKVWQVAQASLQSSTEGADAFLDLSTAELAQEAALPSRFRFVEAGVEWAQGVQGVVLRNNAGGNPSELRMQVSKVSPSQDNLLFTYDNSSWTGFSGHAGVAANPYTGRVSAVIVGNGQCRVYNPDGTEYTGTLNFSNIVIS